MIRELKVIFETHAAVESYEASKQFFGCMMEEGSSVSEHVFAMSGHARKLSDLGIVIPNQLGIHRVLQSLPPSYKNFVMNYNMQNMNKELPELFSMLKSAEVEIQKEHQVLMVNKTTSFKKQGKPKKGNFKKGGKKAAAPPEKPKGGPKPDTDCYYCNGKGHWKRNCPKYLADLKSGLVKKKKGISDIHVIDVYLTGSRTSAWSSAVPEDVPVPPAPITEEANDNDHETSSEVATEPRRSTRERTTPDWYDPCLNVMIVDNNDEDPATYEEAMMSPDSNKWQEAMKSEMGSMYDNKVWTLVDLPDSRKAVENKWIFKRKTDADGNVTVYKARLVAKGFRQIQGVDYDETFSPVAKLKSVRILLAIAAFFDYEIWQMDVKTAFLNGDIEEELYMVQPKGFVDPKNADKSLAYPRASSPVAKHPCSSVAMADPIARAVAPLTAIKRAAPLSFSSRHQPPLSSQHLLEPSLLNIAHHRPPISSPEPVTPPRKEETPEATPGAAVCSRRLAVVDKAAQPSRDPAAPPCLRPTSLAAPWPFSPETTTNRRSIAILIVRLASRVRLGLRPNDAWPPRWKAAGWTDSLVLFRKHLLVCADRMRKQYSRLALLTSQA
ncbi:hypothetical protein QYE76_065999 [Lolium multiflorum]|uniref:CCHC-type domain-containing protein n=1 Tax=Lolium multiflorum TaxID=4521 RepID=A0AAD8S9Y8_LOLMU|nr:hypothetical protein QYE76_065999 [Lolium multiflorum]